MRLTRLAMLFASVLALTATGLTGFASGDDFVYLEPGERASLEERVPVQFVFVGYEPSQVAKSAFLSALPQTYEPVIRSRLWYGVVEPLGISYTFKHKVVYTSSDYEDAFFGALEDLSAPADLTLFQQQYNAQKKNVLDVADNHFIDAPSVEEWLAEHPPSGVDTTRNTVFFVNWWGRSDFEHHVYTKFGEPDPDTGYDFGVNRESRKIIAWGGTPPDDEETGFGGPERRVWFYDLSAGPEAWTDNWNVDRRDVDGDGTFDYRMPPIWEYLTPGGYRSSSALTGDLAKVARYVAINLLFTPSPLYPPALTPPGLPASVSLDLNTYEGWAGVDASAEYQTPAMLQDEVAEVHPLAYSVDQQEMALEGQARTCYLNWLKGTRCYTDRPQYPAFANLFLDAALNIDSLRDGGGDYDAVLVNYASTDEAAFLGFADDNWVDGTQSGVFNFVSPGIVEFGYGLTTTQIHEYGHHFGMSHPHDGYDSEQGVDYGPGGSMYFAWSGDEVNSMMSYIDLNWDFSQFDRDNARRFLAAAYITNANAIAAAVLDDPDAAAAATDLALADEDVGAAEAAMAGHDYDGAFEHARAAYAHAVDAADVAGVEVEVSENGWFVQPPRRDWKGPTAKRGYSYRDRIAPGSQRVKI